MWHAARRFFRLGLLLGCVVVSTMNVGLADELKIGLKAELTSADPHVLNGPNRNVLNHVYETLVASDGNLRPRPGLALSWRLVNPTTWEFRLRPGVKFHNGAALSAEDVKYSLERAMKLTGARTYRSYLRDVDSISVAAPGLVHVKLKAISPTLPENLGLVAIIPHSLGDNVSEESFADGKSAIGTGPYKYVQWKRGESVLLVRNPDYWGQKEPWDKVWLQFIPREPARAAALISGGVDIISDVPANQEASLKNFATVSVTSYMLNYLMLDQFRDDSPYIKDANGQPLSRNPFKDLKVRQALAHAINREGLIKFLMKADATATEQLVPKGFFGHEPSFKGLPYDVNAARSLLAQAGYPNGFRLTMHCSNNRYINDAKLCEAIAQALNQIGIKTDVSALPFSVFLTRLAGGGANGEPEFSMALLGTGAVTGDSLTLLTAMIHTQGKGSGANNYGRYANQAVDALIDKAGATNDEQARLELQKQAARLALQDQAVVPLQHINVAWAMKKQLSIVPSADGFTMATQIRRK